MQTLTLLIALHVLFAYDSRGANSLKEDCNSIYDTLTRKYVYTYVDKMPEYAGGNSAVLKFLVENFKYPKQEEFHASFQIEFVIDSDGKLIGQRIKNKTTSNLTSAEKELLKVLDKMPKWQPGECHGKKVPVQTFFPLKF
jgi:protein TonB